MYTILLIIVFLISTPSFTQICDIKELSCRHVSYDSKDGLLSDDVTCFAMDKNGFIWIGTISGLNVFDGHTFKSIDYNPSSKNFLSNRHIISLYADEWDCLWIGTYKGLNRYNLRDNQFQNFSETDSILYSLNHSTSITMEQGKQNVLWIGSSSGLYMTHMEKIPQQFTKIEEEKLSSTTIQSLL